MGSVGQMSHDPTSLPSAPLGWHTTWSDQHKQWYYVNTATGVSQWDYPSVSRDVSKPEPNPQTSHQVPDQNQTPQPEHALPQDGSQQESSRGLMSMAAGAIIGHELHEHSHHGSHNNMLGSVTALVGSAGVGALGAKLFGGKKPPKPAHNPPQASNPPYQSYQAPPPQPSYYPTQSPPPPNHQGHSGYGNYAMGAAAAAGAMSMAHHASNYPQQQHYQQPYPSQQQQHGPPPPAAYGGAGAYQSGPPASGAPRLNIHAAAFADKDVTQTVRMLVTSDQKISIQKKMVEEFGDPWPEAERKGLSILYQYGDRPMEVWAGDTTDETVVIKNEGLSNEKMSFVNKHPGRVVCLIWGEENVLTDVRREKLEKDGELDAKDLGNGNWWAWEQRTLICYYRGANGNIEMAHARQGGTLRLPWNPLAKWS